MTVTAHFASLRSELVVVERSAIPVFEYGRQVGTQAGKQHEFKDHQCRVEGQKSIDFMRARAKAPDNPGLWELEGSSDVPPTDDLLMELATADITRVREILKAERDGPNREKVMATCQKILDKAGVAERGPGAQKAETRHEVVA